MNTTVTERLLKQIETLESQAPPRPAYSIALLQEAADEIAQLRRALRRYGQHGRDCLAAHKWRAECTCGFSETYRAMFPKRED